MPKFIVIEQSLRVVGGHFFEYAMEILTAADRAGFQPVLAVGSDFHELDRFPDHWQVHPVFEKAPPDAHAPPRRSLARLATDLEGRASLGDKAWTVVKAGGDEWIRLRNRVRARFGERRGIQSFAESCARLFSRVELAEGDHVFCSTMEASSLTGLVEFLAATPTTRVAEWHVQFHINVFAGRDPDYAEQERHVRELRRRFEATRRLPDHRLHFYATTDELARQFARLGGSFATLPWSISDRFAPGPEAEHATPLKLLIPGSLRREKGKRLLRPLVDAIAGDPVLRESVQLWVQCQARRRKLLEPLREVTTFVESPAESPDTLVVALPHPLDPEDYTELIRRADVGLLLYDADAYFARCSGILVELLATATPVVVPSGTWLANQIEGVNQEHLQGLFSTAPCVEEHDLAAPSIGRERALEQRISLASPVRAGDLLVAFEPAGDPLAGRYVRVRLEQLASTGASLGVSTATPSIGDGAAPRLALFHLRDETASLRLQVRDAFRPEPLRLRSWTARVIRSPEGRHHPLGKVGLSVDSPLQVPELLRDLVAAYDHYRHGAQEFSKEWRRTHSAARTIEQLTESVRSAARECGPVR